MKYPLLIVLMMLSGVSASTAQSAKAFEKAGDKAFAQKDYGAALEYFRNALEINNKKISLSYKYAEVARLFHAYDFAVEYYLRVLDSEEASNFPLTNYWLGMVKKGMGEYDEAKQYFQFFLKQEKQGSKEYIESAKNEIESCDWALEVIKNQPDDIVIQQLNKRVNTPFSEFGSLMKGDTLYYSSLRYDNKNDEHDPPRKISKVLMSIRGSKGRTMKRKFNEDVKNTAHTTFSKDGKRIYYTICEYKENAEIRCQLYYREKDSRKRWGKAQKLPEDINLADFTSTHPNIGVNEKGEEMLYFVSNRIGGKGDLDIWYCSVLKNGKFSDAKNLTEINTPENDITPFYHEATHTLFFSSEGYKGMGGYDIFKTRKVGEQWLDPAHTGFPLNGSYNDVYFTLSQDSTLAYFSSNRLGSMYLDENNKSCCNDIYKVTFKQADSIDLVPPVEDSLTFVNETPVPIPDPTEEIPPSTLEDFLPLALYFDNDEPDKRTKRNTTKKSYSETFSKYYERKHDFVYEFAKDVPDSEKQETEKSVGVFFENKVKRGHDYLDLFSQILLQRLREGEKVEIFVKGFTSPRAESDYNIHLGKRRISSVKNHFKTYNNFIFKPYLDSGKLIISERSFGETTVAEGVNDDLNNQRLSIYSVEASLERRVEIVEIKRE